MPLMIIIVGAGLAGLAAGIGFRQHGHTVKIFERRPQSNREDVGSGIQFQPNVERILEKWDMLGALQQVAHDCVKAELRTHDEGVITHMDLDEAHRGRAWYALRGVMKDLFHDVAIARGVELYEDAKVVHMDPAQPAIVLEDGQTYTADLIVGADGSGSRVRQGLFPDYNAVLEDQACFNVVLPLDKVTSDRELRALINGPYSIITVSPGRNIFASPAPRQNSFDLQCVDHDYSLAQDPHPELTIERLHDMRWLRQRWSDHDAAYRKAFAMADSATKWRFSSVRGVPSWSSANGKVVLIGDAVHAMQPFSGQGSAMGIEDAGALAELLAGAEPMQALHQKLALYERLRRPRCETIQALAQAYGASWSERTPARIQQRNAAWRTMFEQQVGPDIQGSANASWETAEFQHWVNRYDLFEEVQDAIAQ